MTRINYLTVDGLSFKYTAWLEAEGYCRPLGAEVWSGRGPTRYLAAVALAESMGWELEG